MLLKRHRLSRFVVPSPPLSIDGSAPQRILFSTRSERIFAISEGAWRDLGEGRLAALSPLLLAVLVEGQFLVENEEDELASVLRENRRAIDTSDEFVQVIQPSAACQMSCAYCGQQHQGAQLPPDCQDRVIDVYRQRIRARRQAGRPFSLMTVGWFGGEPLLGLSAMRRLSPLLLALADEEGLSYRARVVTNGLRLTAALARELQELHRVEHCEVTLDGPAQFHDTRRPTKAGDATHDRILANLVAIATDESVCFSLSVRCNVDASNAGGVPLLIEELAAAGLERRVRLYFSPVYDWGNDAGRAALSKGDLAAAEIEWFAQMIALGFDVELVPARKPVVCLAVRPDSRVVDAFGREYNCTEAPYVPAYGTPNRLSVSFVGKPSASELPFSGFNDKIASDPSQPCHSCPVLPVCGGACPKAWEESGSPCPSFKRNLPDRLVLNAAASRLVGAR